MRPLSTLKDAAEQDPVALAASASGNAVMQAPLLQTDVAAVLTKSSDQAAGLPNVHLDVANIILCGNNVRVPAGSLRSRITTDRYEPTGISPVLAVDNGLELLV